MNNDKSKIFVTNTTQRFERIHKKKFNQWLISDFLDINEIKDKLKNLVLTARIQMLGIVKRYLTYKGKTNTQIWIQYRNAINELYDELNCANAKNKKTEREKTNFISYKFVKEEFIKYMPKIKEMNYKQFRNCLITSFFVLQPPVRLSNLQHLNYIEPNTIQLKNVVDKTKNYITKNNGIWEVQYNNFKTVLKLGSLSFKITEPHLIELLDIYITRYPIKPNQQFFYAKSDFAESKICSITIGYAITKIIKLITGIDNVTLNTLRHSLITEFYSSVHSIEEKKQLASKMGQTYKINMADYYIKID
tara:strand:- start:33 stop:947 length:915 start_codon:yes stop_codon:yes gene_type:complete